MDGLQRYLMWFEPSSLGTTFWYDNFQHTLRALIPGYPQCDMDVAEMFLNFPLHPDLRPFAGVDINKIKSRPDEEGRDQERNRVWEHWDKNFMGLTDSPYRHLQLLVHVKFKDYEERKDPLNPFQWSHANMNIPGDESYTPKLPWVMKLRSDGHLAS